MLLTSKFGQELAARLKDNKWHPSGATLGFPLGHLYAEVYGAKGKIEPHMLKGSDLLLYQTLVQLGLKPRIVPAVKANLDRDYSEKALLLGKSFREVLNPEYGHEQRMIYGSGSDSEDDSQHDSASDSDSDSDSERLGRRCGTNGCCYYRGEEEEPQFLRDVCGVKEDDDIVWVKQPGKKHCKYKFQTAIYGNEPSMKSWYFAAVLLVDVGNSPRALSLDQATTSKQMRLS